MSIPILTQVYDETRRLAIAGSVVAANDFRLKKLLPPLEKAGEKAPVFAKVAQAMQAVLDSNEKTSAAALLDLSTLVNAILYTQGQTGAEGKLAPLELIDLGPQDTQTSARMLKPLIEALTSTGSGRFEIIRDAIDRGAFRDLRLIKPALQAIGDTYAEIGDLVADKVLPMYGKAIWPELQNGLDVKGRGQHVRRLQLMHKLDPAATREWVTKALEEGSKEMRVAAIECLGSEPEDLAHLLEHAKSKNKEVRGAAIRALAICDDKAALEMVQSAISGADIELVARHLKDNRNPKLIQFVLAECEKTLQDLLSPSPRKKTSGKADSGAQRHAQRFHWLLDCLVGRDDKPVQKFLIDCFERREELDKLKGDIAGRDLVHRLIEIMARGPEPLRRALIDAHATLRPEDLVEAMLAAIAICPREEVFDRFSPYVAAQPESKKRNDPAQEKRTALIDLLSEPWLLRHYMDESTPYDESYDAKTCEMLDSRWLDLAVKMNNLDLVLTWARPGHKASLDMIGKLFQEQIGKNRDANRLSQALEAMIRMEHPEATDALIATIAKRAKSTRSEWELYWIVRLIPSLPKDAVPRLEELLPSLPDKIVDNVLDQITALKEKP